LLPNHLPVASILSPKTFQKSQVKGPIQMIYVRFSYDKD